MLKRVAAVAALALSLGTVPMLGHADPTNACVATDVTGPGIGVATLGALTCTYTAGAAKGQIVQATPNHIAVTYVNDAGDTVTIYDQDTLTPPGAATFDQPAGKVITVTVGPDSPGFGEGAIGLVVAGDAS
jgi:hypothetical protein